MNFSVKQAVLVTSLIVLSQSSMADTPAPESFTPAQQEAIGKIAADYMVAHPEILLKVSQELQKQQAQQQAAMFTQGVLDNQSALLNDKNTPVVGPAGAKVAVIEFFDYQCIYCSHMAPIVEQVMKHNGDVKFIFKEWPIFGSRWQPSITAAQTGLTVWQEQGATAYINYHNGIYKTGHNEGKLTVEDIAGVLKHLKMTPPPAPALAQATAALATTDQLAKSLGLNGTPAFIILPTAGAGAQNITVFAGAVEEGDLQSAIKKAAGQ